MFKLINNFFNHSKNDLFKKNTLDIQKNFPVKKIFDAIKSFSDESDIYYVGGCAVSYTHPTLPTNSGV